MVRTRWSLKGRWSRGMYATFSVLLIWAALAWVMGQIPKIMTRDSMTDKIRFRIQVPPAYFGMEVS
jgi:hypothetical protein